MGQLESVSERDKRVVRTIWTHVTQNRDNFAKEFFAYMYGRYPGMATHFPVKSVNDPRFETHAFKVVDELNTWVSHIDDHGKLISLLNENAIRHARHRIRAEFYENLGECLITTLANTVPAKDFGQQAQLIVQKLFTTAMRHILQESEAERAQRAAHHVQNIRLSVQKEMQRIAMVEENRQLGEEERVRTRLALERRSLQEEKGAIDKDDV